MSPKIYTQEFKEAAVKFYERNHTIDETIAEFNISESSLFEWRKKYIITYMTHRKIHKRFLRNIFFYNEERPHRKLNMKTPAQFESEFISH